MQIITGLGHSNAEDALRAEPGIHQESQGKKAATACQPRKYQLPSEKQEAIKLSSAGVAPTCSSPTIGPTPLQMCKLALEVVHSAGVHEARLLTVARKVVS